MIAIECKINQTIYNYRNLYHLISVAPKLLNCRPVNDDDVNDDDVNDDDVELLMMMTSFVNNYEILQCLVTATGFEPTTT